MVGGAEGEGGGWVEEGKGGGNRRGRARALRVARALHVVCALHVMCALRVVGGVCHWRGVGG